MILYVDETEHEEYFIVAGLLASSKHEVDLAYKKFKKSVKNYPLTSKTKQKIFLEFKSTLIDKQYQKIKARMLRQIKEIDGIVIYSYYVKKQKNMKQILKESVYITLLANIINSIDKSTNVIFDEFKNKKFEDLIAETFKNFDNIETIAPYDSQEEHGLQFADNICSVVRLHLTEQDNNKYYSYIKSMIKEV